MTIISNEVRAEFADVVVIAKLNAAGFTVAGGSWGDAAWLQVGPELVVSIGQGDGMTTDMSSAPYSETDPCRVYVYRGRPYAGWTVAEGEAPTDDFEMIDVSDLAGALATVRGIQNGR